MTLRQNSDSPGPSSVASVVELTQTRRLMPWTFIARHVGERLERAGHVSRARDDTDRRKVLLRYSARSCRAHHPRLI